MRLGFATLAAFAVAGSGAASGTAGPLPTAILPSYPSPSAFAAIRASGATLVRIEIPWNSVAPTGAAPPSGFDAANPADPAYRWASADAKVKAAVAAGLQPMVQVLNAPEWAEQGKSPAGTGPSYPNAADFGEFAKAIALRFDGRFEGLPRVRYWEVWNEPNLSPDLWPQLVNGKPVSPGLYRALVNAFSAGVKSVHANNVVVAGETAPFRDITPATYAQDKDWGPLSFMRALLCLSPSLHPTCHDPIHFDVWSTHPYTSGGPTHHAVLPNDVSIGDLPKMKKVLDAAVAHHEIVSRGPVRFWVTEFSWDSKPPDPLGVPTALLDRWVPQAMYVFWLDGVSLVTWFSVWDEPVATSPYQSGLYYRNGKAKPYREGFRFPFVAFPRKNGVYTWGRTPAGKPGVVSIEQRIGDGRWKRLGLVRSSPSGIFQRTFKTVPRGRLRARLTSTGETTLAFSLTAVPDHFYNAFGSTTPFEPKPKK